MKRGRFKNKNNSSLRGMLYDYYFLECGHLKLYQEFLTNEVGA
jgi:hypothetical protein